MCVWWCCRYRVWSAQSSCRLRKNGNRLFQRRQSVSNEYKRTNNRRERATRKYMLTECWSALEISCFAYILLVWNFSLILSFIYELRTLICDLHFAFQWKQIPRSLIHIRIIIYVWVCAWLSQGCVCVCKYMYLLFLDLYRGSRLPHMIHIYPIEVFAYLST